MNVQELVEDVYREGDEEARRSRDPYVTLSRLEAVYISLTDRERPDFDRVMGDWLRDGDAGKRYDALALIDLFKMTDAIDSLHSLRDKLAAGDDVESRNWLETVDEVIARIEEPGDRPDVLLMGLGDHQRMSSAAVHWLAMLLKKDASFIVRSDHSEDELGAAGAAMMEAGAVEVHRRKGVKLEPPLSAIYGQVFEGSVMISVEHERADKSYLRTYHVAGDDAGIAIEHIPQPTDQHDFYVFAEEDLFKRVAAFTGLAEDRVVATDPSFVVPLPDLVAAVQGSTGGAVPEPFAEHLGRKVSSTRVRTALRTETGLGGGEVMWIDLGPQGLWTIDQSEENMAAVGPASPEDVIARIEAVLSP